MMLQRTKRCAWKRTYTRLCVRQPTACSRWLTDRQPFFLHRSVEVGKIAKSATDLAHWSLPRLTPLLVVHCHAAAKSFPPPILSICLRSGSATTSRTSSCCSKMTNFGSKEQERMGTSGHDRSSCKRHGCQV